MWFVLNGSVFIFLFFYLNNSINKIFGSVPNVPIDIIDGMPLMSMILSLSRVKVRTLRERRRMSSSVSVVWAGHTHTHTIWPGRKFFSSKCEFAWIHVKEGYFLHGLLACSSDFMSKCQCRFSLTTFNFHNDKLLTIFVIYIVL